MFFMAIYSFYEMVVRKKIKIKIEMYVYTQPNPHHLKMYDILYDDLKENNFEHDNWHRDTEI